MKRIILINNNGKKWVVNEPTYDAVQQIRTKFGVSYSTALILASREIDNVEKFLNPHLIWPDISKLPDIEQAIAAIQAAIEGKLTIGIVGDYDVDGISAAVMWSEFLDFCGVKRHVWLPNRTQAYGASDETLRFFAECGANEEIGFIIMVDCGSSAYDFLSKVTCPVVIIDHHMIDQNRTGHPLVNPHRGDAFVDEYKNSCAAVLTMLVIQHLNEKLNLSYPKQKLLDLATLGTVCDVMQIDSLNRSIIVAGMDALNLQLRPGIQALLQKMKARLPLQSSDIAFGIGPRLNAAARLGDAQIAFDLLISKDIANSFALAEKLEQLNLERRTLQEVLFDDAKTQAAAEIGQVICLASAHWHPGIVGILASMLEEKFCKPAIIGNIGKIGVKASARARTIHIGKLITTAVEQKIVASGGGHAAAGGLMASIEQWKNFQIWANKQVLEKNDDSEISVDAVIDLKDLSPDYNLFAPHGPGNKEIMIVTKEVKVQAVKPGPKYTRVIVMQNFLTYTFFVANKNIELIEFLSNCYGVLTILIKLSGTFHSIEDATLESAL